MNRFYQPILVKRNQDGKQTQKDSQNTTQTAHDEADRKRIRKDISRRTTQDDCTSSPQPVLAVLSDSLIGKESVAHIMNEKELNKWTENESVMYKLANQKPQDNAKFEMIAFDMDGTLIKTKSGNTFPVDEYDWKWWDSSVPTKLQQLHTEGIYLAIISNQSKMGTPINPIDALQRKVDRIIEGVGVPIDFICAKSDDVFRKPRTGMWEFLTIARCPALTLTKQDSTYVGDAAGRPKMGTHTKDFSDTDFKLAFNLGINFATPEKFFLNDRSRLHCNPQFKEMTQHIALSKVVQSSIDPSIFAKRGDTVELVVLVAPPSVGKSTLARKFVANGFIRVNQDTLKTVDKCLKVAEESLATGRSVVVDNTNIDRATRKKWLDIAEKYGATPRCVALTTSKDICFSLEVFRRLDPSTDPCDRRAISSVAIHSGYKKLNSTPLDISEGFSQIDQIPWSPDLSPEAGAVTRRLFDMHLL